MGCQPVAAGRFSRASPTAPVRPVPMNYGRLPAVTLNGALRSNTACYSAFPGCFNTPPSPRALSSFRSHRRITAGSPPATAAAQGLEWGNCESLRVDAQLLNIRRVVLDSLRKGVEDLKEEDIPEPFRVSEWHEAEAGEGATRLHVECRVFSSSVFCRIPSALICVEGGFQAFLVCAEPREEFELPIFGAEVVSRGGKVTVAFMDCSPVNEAHSLPDELKQQLLQHQSQHGLESMPIRKTPQEFQEVFSDVCVVKMPKDESIEDFVSYVGDALKDYLSLASTAAPVKSSAARESLAAAQRKYMNLGLSNAEKKVVPVMRTCASPERTERFLKWFWLNQFGSEKEGETQ
eukprot:CAMPEP_0177773838 /NCGR_PEP_ID=MMETSP0491_2-20121128/13123_1 /TAXON_ID=63592 /ORGANISM="Tetraselmis chuii, Strain PLY429" /LENGTH=347 /DNA_ID=CAMNT_0019292049 /DNA_START=129 /DNA_END=1172 /DNA_ORIENTATION=-